LLYLSDTQRDVLECFSHRDACLPEFFYLECFLEFFHCFLQPIELADSTLKQVFEVLKAQLFVSNLSFREGSSNNFVDLGIIVVTIVLEGCCRLGKGYNRHGLVGLFSLSRRVLHKLTELLEKLFINSVGFFGADLSL
jgi:hypothetical protein